MLADECARSAVNGSAVFGAYQLENVVKKISPTFNVSHLAMDFHWQHMPQVWSSLTNQYVIHARIFTKRDKALLITTWVVKLPRNVNVLNIST